MNMYQHAMYCRKNNNSNIDTIVMFLVFTDRYTISAINVIPIDIVNGL